MKFPVIFIALILVSSCASVCKDELKPTQGISAKAYCEKFARKYSKNFQEGSVRILKQSNPNVENIFQPKGSKFTGEYKCYFNTTKSVSVHILLTDTKCFAEHSQSDDLQIIPIEYIKDSKQGYGIFKYLD